MQDPIDILVGHVLAGDTDHASLHRAVLRPLDAVRHDLRLHADGHALARIAPKQGHDLKVTVVLRTHGCHDGPRRHHVTSSDANLPNDAADRRGDTRSDSQLRLEPVDLGVLEIDFHLLDALDFREIVALRLGDQFHQYLSRGGIGERESRLVVLLLLGDDLVLGDHALSAQRLVPGDQLV